MRNFGLMRDLGDKVVENKKTQGSVPLRFANQSHMSQTYGTGGFMSMRNKRSSIPSRKEVASAKDLLYGLVKEIDNFQSL